jgi:hypothetical protein
VDKFEPYSRRAVRRRRTTWLRDNAAKVAVVLSCFALMLAIATAVVIATVPSPQGGYLLGALHVGLVFAALHILHMAIPRT